MTNTDLKVNICWFVLHFGGLVGTDYFLCDLLVWYFRNNMVHLTRICHDIEGKSLLDTGWLNSLHFSWLIYYCLRQVVYLLDVCYLINGKSLLI